MAKKAYIGVGGKARRVKRMYVGAETQVPVYGTGTVNITTSNISTMFTVSNGTYYFAGSGSVFTTNNGGKASSTASTTLTAKQDMTVSFTYSYSTEASYDKFTLTFAGTTVENAVSGATTTKTYSGKLTTGQRILFQYSKDGNYDRNDDQCTFSNMSVITQVQTGSTTKSVARSVKKVYVGVGGVARLCWSRGLEYYGRAAPLSVARSNLAATSVGDYAVFGGGENSKTDDYQLYTVDAYSSSLVQIIPEEFSVRRRELAATNVGNYALFGGGYGYDFCNTVESYSRSLTRSTESSLSMPVRDNAATSVGDYALFGGGYGKGTNYSSYVDAYNTSLTKKTATSFDVSKDGHAATTVGNYAMFAGGGNGVTDLKELSVYAYSKSLTKNVLTPFTENLENLAAATAGNYALFGGGDSSAWFGNGYDTVYAYSSSLTQLMATPLSVARSELTAATIGNYAIFAGGDKYGWSSNVELVSTVDIYDESLTRTTGTSLSEARNYLASTTVGNYALFGGGSASGKDSGVAATVDVYTIG